MKALVIGFGKSGQGAAHLLLHQGYEVIGVDRSLDGKELEGVLLLSERDPLPHFDFDLVVISPGVPLTHPLAERAFQEGVELIGEAELAFRELENPCIGVTGTNGKTTLTLFLAHLLNTAGKKARALGNVGESLAGSVIELDPETIVVAELSSFQLETLSTQALDVGMITTITPDHLDRYPSLEAYAQVKMHIKDLIKSGGEFFMPEERRPLVSNEKTGPDSYLQLSIKERYWEKSDGDLFDLAFAACKRWGVDEKDLIQAKKTFVRPPHRFERLGEIEGVTYYNDSKGTNPEAVLFALEQLDSPVVLIAGGLDKGGCFELWKGPFKGKVKKVCAIGKAASLIQETLQGSCPVEVYRDLDDAAFAAKACAKPGDVLLLSPGCASFDQFANFEERGNRFKQLFQKLRS